jgi:tRNA wybutosine-synthesizing protein 3
MKFDNEKKNCLDKLVTLDNSKKGTMDIEIAPLVNLINKHPNFYTTSSCAGRIMVLSPSFSGKKFETKWLFQSHSLISYEDIGFLLNDPPKDDVWFRMESPILHIASRDMESADWLLKKANDSGFRRSGLLSFANRIIAEIFIPERIDAPLSSKGKRLAEERYVKFLIRSANQRLKRSRQRLKKMEKIFTSSIAALSR